MDLVRCIVSKNLMSKKTCLVFIVNNSHYTNYTKDFIDCIGSVLFLVCSCYYFFLYVLPLSQGRVGKVEEEARAEGQGRAQALQVTSLTDPEYPFF